MPHHHICPQLFIRWSISTALLVFLSSTTRATTNAFSPHDNNLYNTIARHQSISLLSSTSTTIHSSSSHNDSTTSDSAAAAATERRKTIPTKPIAGMKLGTSGLRKKVEIWQQPNYMENFIQALIDTAKCKNQNQVPKT